MKKYLFVSSFFVLGTIITLMFFWSYQIYDRSMQSSTQEISQEEQAKTVDTVKEIRVNASMKYVVEVYDGITDVLTSEEDTVPEEIAGMTREELEAYISNYNKAVEINGAGDGPDSMELISFSKDRVVVREVYHGMEDEAGFFLKMENDEVVIFHKDQITPYEYTGITSEMIPPDEREQLLAGYFVADEKELYSILENLSS